MPDLAELGIRVTSQEAAVADKNLDSLAASADRAETSVEKLAAAARRSDGAVSTMNVAVRQQTAVLAATRNAMGLTTAEGLNLSRQFADIGVTAAMGMNPLMIAIQQGPQLLDIFQTAAIRTGTTVKVVAAQAGAALWTAVAPLLPLVVAVGAAVGTMASLWGLATRSLTSDIGNVTKEMGLSEKQLDKLKEKGVSTTVTAGDAFKALGTTIKEMFASVFGDELAKVSKWWKEFLDGATRFAVNATAGIAAAFIGTFYAVRDNWRALPAVMADVSISAANFVINAMNAMIRKAVDGINSLAPVANGFLAGMGSNIRVGQMAAAPQIGSIANPNQGAATAAIADIGSGYVRAFGQATGAMESFYARWQANTRDTAQARIRAGAGDAGAANDNAAREKTERETMWSRPSMSLRDLGIKKIKLEDPIVQQIRDLKRLQDELRMVDDLARDAGRGMAEAFGEAGRSMGDLLTIMTGFQARLGDIAVAQAQGHINASQAARERSAAEVQAYGDALGAAKGFFREGSDGYRALQAAEQVYRAYQFAMAIQSMVMSGQETAFTVGQNLIRSASHGVVAIARALASLPFPFNMAAGVATAAALAAIGVKIFGGGKSGGSSVSASASTAQGYSAQDANARTTAAQAIASQVSVVVTADRQGMNAYVKETATGVATPMAVGAYQESVSTSREIVPQDQAQKGSMMLRAGRR